MQFRAGHPMIGSFRRLFHAPAQQKGALDANRLLFSCHSVCLLHNPAERRHMKPPMERAMKERKYSLETLTVTLRTVTKNGKSLALEVVLELLERPVLTLVDLLGDTLGELDGLETTSESRLSSGADHLVESGAGGGSNGERASGTGTSAASGRGAGSGPEGSSCDVGVHVVYVCEGERDSFGVKGSRYV